MLVSIALSQPFPPTVRPSITFPLRLGYGCGPKGQPYLMDIMRLTGLCYQAPGI